MHSPCIVTLALSIGLCTPILAADEVVFPRFQPQEIDTGLKIGYAVIAADINGDGKPDLVVVDQHQVVWYENPTWKKRVILDGKTKPDNVCVAAIDIDGDGKLDLVLGAGWRPSDTSNPGTLQWLKNPGVMDKEWAMYPIPCDEPTVHRLRVAKSDRDDKPQIIVAPLQGRDCTAKGNWTDGRPVRIVAYKVPANPEKPESWKPTVLSEELHVVHNFWPIPIDGETALLTASYEGVHMVFRDGDRWRTRRKGAGDQKNARASRGASEVKMCNLGGKFGQGLPWCYPTIEPWHGNQVVVYSMEVGGDKLWDRYVIDDHLRWGHAVWCADLDGDGAEELIIGVRDDPNPKQGDTFTERRGVRIYKCTDGKGEKWTRQIIEDGGVAVEDLTAADLDGDGKIDIIAVGRQTGNARIYWNRGMEKK